jgi:DNA-binding SARP family transcriptional activator
VQVIQMHVVGGVRTSGARVEPPQGLATRLLGLLAARAGEDLSTPDLVEVLWFGEDPPRDPPRVVASLVSRLRAALGRDLIVGGPRQHRLVADERVEVDLLRARRLLRTAVEADRLYQWSDALAAASAAAALLGAGEILPGEPAVGVVVEVRRRGADELRRARELAWTAGLHLGATRQALEHARAAVAADPADEPAVRAAMAAHARDGEVASALRLFEQLRAELVEELGADPSPLTQQLHQALLRDEEIDTRLVTGRPLGTAQLDRLSAEDRDMLNRAAVLGESFDLDRLAELARMPVDDVTRIARRALDSGVLREEGPRLAFADRATHAAAYAAAPQAVRASRHRRAAALAPDDPATQARHRDAAGDHAEAAQAWGRAAASHRDVPRVAERLLGKALTAAAAAGSRRVEADLLQRRGMIRVELGRFDDACSDLQAALDAARRLADEDLEARALEGLGVAALYARDAVAALDLVRQARELAESAAGAPQRTVSALLLVGRVRHWDGDLRGAAQAYDAVLSGRRDPDLRALAMAYKGALLEHQDRFVDARRLLDRAVRECIRTGQFRGLVQSLFFAAMARGNAGDLAGALRLLGQARSLLDERGLDYYRAGVDSTEAWVRRELGDLPRAHELAGRALEEARRSGGALELEQELHALLALAENELAEGRHDEAAALVVPAEASLSEALPFSGRARLRVLDVSSRLIPERSEELLAAARAASSPKYQAIALGRLGRREESLSVARTTGSDLLLATLDGSPEARAAVDRIARRLPAALRRPFQQRHAE